ncbi:MAG: prepilin-type N-terminal cleavage/methylation domain-containing protein [Acidimicrobiales bacterium]
MPRGGCASRALSVETSRSSRHADDGFTLVELLVVLVILPLIVGATSLSLVSVLSLKTSVSDRLGASADAQIFAASFYSDVQSAAQFTTNPTPSNPTPCGTSSQILGFEWGVSSPTTVVSYAVVPNGTLSAKGVAENSLIRYECTISLSNGTRTVTDTRTLSYNVPTSLPLRVVGSSCPTLIDASPPSCLSADVAGAEGWTSAAGVQSINVTASKAATNSAASHRTCTAGITFCYGVAAAPRL